MGKKSKDSKKTKHQADQEAVAVAPKKKLSTKEYEKELYNLQAELCKLQEWVVQKGLRVFAARMLQSPPQGLGCCVPWP